MSGNAGTSGNANDDDPTSQARAQVRDGLTALFHLSGERVYLQFLALFEEYVAMQTAQTQATPATPLLASVTAGGWHLDPARRTLTHAGDPISLDPTETRVCHLLMRHADHVVTAAALVDRVWHGQADLGTVRHFIAALRGKLRAHGHIATEIIVTVPGVGYAWRVRETGEESER